MDVRAAEISAILKDQIKNFGQEAEVTEVGQVLSVGDGDVGRHFALELRHQRTEGADHVADGKQAAVGGQDFEEFCGGAGNPGFIENGVERLRLGVGREYRAADEALEIGAFVQHGLELVEVGFDGVDGFLLARQLEQGRSITAGHSRNGRIFSSHRDALFCCQIRKGKTVATGSGAKRSKPLEFKRDFDFRPAREAPGPLKSRLC